MCKTPAMTGFCVFFPWRLWRKNWRPRSWNGRGANQLRTRSDTTCAFASRTGQDGISCRRNCAWSIANRSTGSTTCLLRPRTLPRCRGTSREFLTVRNGIAGRNLRIIDTSPEHREAEQAPGRLFHDRIFSVWIDFRQFPERLHLPDAARTLGGYATLRVPCL